MTALSRRTFIGAVGAAGAAALVGTPLASAASRPRAASTVYVGSYTNSAPAGHGLDVAQRAAGSPALTQPHTVGKLTDVSWFDRTSDGRTLYVTNENEGSATGTVSALDISDPANPKLLGATSSKGGSPTHLSVHPSQKYVLAANYDSGSVVVLPIKSGGKLGAATDVQQHQGKEPHAHQVLTDPSGKWVLAVDLGTDSVYVYSFDTGNGKLKLHKQITLPAGAGPRHLAFHPNGQFAYVAQELRPEITVASWDAATGAFKPIAVVPAVPAGSTGDLFPGEIAVSKDGKFVYATVRGPNTIATFTVADGGAALKLASSAACGGNWPRHLVLDADEKWFYVSNQKSGTVTWLPRDPATGLPGKSAGSLAVPNVNSVFFV
ncbi:lactonase family protein [Amycolatopsis benzoatilytica]|uniref:lactonase family protein n=1 Tax=Amycolatopsis benzoatilytica TaxID=346045 RepID=UPI00035E693F|nr:lactonase family protein [Amycolatopsis benzoatilytica]